jgi:hypothetical protein
MGRYKSVGELTELLEQAKRRKAAMEKRKVESTATPQKAKDKATVYYRDPVIAGRLLKLTVPQAGIIKFGGSTLAAGITACGLLADAPDGSSAVEILKGSKVPIIKICWYFGDANAKRVPTDWGTVYTKPYDADGGQSHYSIPFTTASGTLNVNTLITKFNEFFDSDQEANKRNLIGVLGEATLTIGYGNQTTILARAK